ncbi:chitin deacetylase 7-like [Centruroides vittatus]|uniref:chitin deacetylase 7-like n=1 Tax=Centruroides vittatus TaxID=120091 RepID=UPI00350FA11D
MAWLPTILLLVLTVTFAVGQRCTVRRCKLPKCSCFNTKTPGNLTKNDIPQFVMLSFDDAVTIMNFNNTYKHLFLGNYKNKPNGCNIAATFFVTHEYADYQLCHELHRYGSEMAVHSISHEASTDMWKSANYNRWKKEMVGMRDILSKFALIDSSKIKGHRAPFLQTAGDVTFEMLNREGFDYDSTMPTLNYVGNDECKGEEGESEGPMWPYTLDYGYEDQDCQIEPCPEKKHEGLWEVPLVSYTSVKDTNFKCSMADACTPYPTTIDDTFEFFKENFDRHYDCNRAPFPVFLHEAWLQNEQRHKGYFKFVKWLLKKDDVYIVTIQTVLEYMKNPVKEKDYRQANCVTALSLPPSKCSGARNCEYKNLKQFYDGTRYMKSCISCPSTYPWWKE